jgi:hypothetical protein
MWIRGDLKARARRALRENGYWIALAAVVIVVILTGALSSAGRGMNVEYRTHRTELYRYLDDEQVLPIIGRLGFAFSILACAYAIFVGAPLSVGKSRFFLEHRLRPSTVGSVFRPFGPGYLNVVKTMFFTGLFIFLWSLLFIIPGIVKAYQYVLVPYIMAENPNMEWQRALALSRKMTDGCKFDIFVLHLSFIGWCILGVLALGVGILFVGPYIEATSAELYATLRQKALEHWYATARELPGVE